MALEPSTVNTAQSLFGNATDLIKGAANSASGASDPHAAALAAALAGACDPMKSAFDVLCQAITEIIHEVNSLPH